jgi:hypothetical protein
MYLFACTRPHGRVPTCMHACAHTHTDKEVTYCLRTVTNNSRTRFTVTLYVYCLSCYVSILIKTVHQYTMTHVPALIRVPQFEKPYATLIRQNGWTTSSNPQAMTLYLTHDKIRWNILQMARKRIRHTAITRTTSLVQLTDSFLTTPPLASGVKRDRTLTFVRHSLALFIISGVWQLWTEIGR